MKYHLFFIFLSITTFLLTVAFFDYPKQDYKTKDAFRLVNSENQPKTENKNIQGFVRPLVSLTYDDGVQSQFENAKPILAKYDLHATFFLMSGMLNNPGYMRDNQVKELIMAGHELGSHSVSQTYLKDLGSDKLARDLKKSKDELSEKFSIKIKDFASPGGLTLHEDVEAISKYYRSNRIVNRVSEESLNYKTNFDIYRIRARLPEVSTTASDLRKWVGEAKNSNAWLVLVYHEIDDSGQTFSVTPENFDAQLSEIKNSGVTVVTMDQALGEIMLQVDSK